MLLLPHTGDMHQFRGGSLHPGHRRPALQLDELDGQPVLFGMMAHEDDVDESRVPGAVGLVERGRALDDHLDVPTVGGDQILGKMHQALCPGGTFSQRGVGTEEVLPPRGEVGHHTASRVQVQQIPRCQFQQEHGHEVDPPGHE